VIARRFLQTDDPLGLAQCLGRGVVEDIVGTLANALDRVEETLLDPFVR
jgi:hypothetical protein